MSRFATIPPFLADRGIGVHNLPPDPVDDPRRALPTCETGSAVSTSGVEPASRRSRYRRRMDEIRARIADLHERDQRLAAELASPAMVDEVRRAAQFADIALQRAAEAATRAVQARLEAARAHDRAAKVFERLGSADPLGDYAARALRHRQAAAADRAAAEQMAARLSSSLA